MECGYTLVTMDDPKAIHAPAKPSSPASLLEAWCEEHGSWGIELAGFG
jgi:hypothetical protein